MRLPRMYARSLLGKAFTMAAGGLIQQEKLSLSPPALPLKKMLLVGALTAKDHATLVVNDELRARLTLQGLNDLGAVLDPELEIDTANIDPAEGGEDFLTGSCGKTDILVVCYVFNPASQGDASFYNAYYHSNSLAVSPHHFEKNAWRDAAEASGANALFVFGGDAEVNKDHFKGGAFSHVGDDPRGWYSVFLRSPTA